MLVRQTPAEATSQVQQSRVEFLMFCPRLFASLSTFFYVTSFLIIVAKNETTVRGFF